MVSSRATEGARSSRATHAARGALFAAGMVLVLAIPTDRWYAARADQRARAEVATIARPHLDALRSAATREVSLLGALASFVDSRRSRAQLDEEFPTFVQGVLVGRGIRAIQLVEGGRIVSVWPIASNEAALGLDVSTHPDARVRDGLARAMAGRASSITGPVPLVQGGLGLIVRQHLRERPGFPDQAAIVLDVGEIVAGAGIPDRATGIVFELYDRDGKWFAGDSAGSAASPETLILATTDGDFLLRVAPVGGWGVMTSRWTRAMRGTLALALVVAALVGWLIGRRRDLLEGEVRRSLTALELVMRASRMGAWEEEVPTGRVRWTPSIEGLVALQGGSEPGVGGGTERLLAAVEPPDRERLRGAIARARTGEANGFVEEVRVRSPGGETRWVLALGDVARDASGKPARIIGVMADASEQRALEERMRHAQRLEALGKLAGGVAHDFNNLLTAIGAFGELARGLADELTPDDRDAVAGDIDHVIATSKRGAALTQQLMTFSQRAPAESTPLDLSAASRELVPTLEQLVAGRATLVTDLARVLPTVLMDAAQFGQVLINLVVNARDAMPKGGTVRVRTTLLPSDAEERPVDAPAGRWVVLEVEDEGVGMSEEVRARIFEPYFTTKPMGRGTGLGLAVVYGIVEGAGGSMTVHSTEGKGTTFRVFVPPYAGSET